MRNGNFSFSRVGIRVTSADLPAFFLKVNLSGVPLYRLEQESTLTVTAELDWKYYRRVALCAKRSGASLKLVSRSGIYWVLRRICCRPVLLLGCLLVMLLTVWLPENILLVEVSGNQRVSRDAILEAAEKCGITFGVSAREVRSENMKNALLEALPDLQWAGINTYGCRAVISVKEKQIDNEVLRDNRVSSVVAACDGVIQSSTATRGSLLCKPGQEVKTGDVLISGYTDCGLMIRATRAEGEVFAQTERYVSVIMPVVYRYRGDIMDQNVNISVIIGKKRINLLKDSGILGTGCVKMYKEYPLLLPGGFSLPIRLVVERNVRYSECVKTADAACCLEVISDYAQSYLLGQLISGKVLGTTSETEQTDNTLIYYGLFSCSEMIGRIRYEGITNLYGKSD